MEETKYGIIVKMNAASAYLTVSYMKMCCCSRYFCFVFFSGRLLCRVAAMEKQMPKLNYVE